MKNNLEQSFLEVIKKSYDAYQTYGSRSNKKLIEIHKWFAQNIINGLGVGYEVKSLGLGGEYKVEGKYYPKTLDVTFLYEGKEIVAISFKFVTSNYAQNSNNYFENLLGETANIRRVGIGFAHYLVLQGHTPYYDKAGGNKRGKLRKTEILSEHHIEKYIRLFKDFDYPHKPDVLGMSIIDFTDNKLDYTDLSKLKFEPETINILKKDFSIGKFVEKVRALCVIKK